MRTLILIMLLAVAASANAASPRLLGPPIKQGDVVDYSCHSASDCSVKDVGNCCGAYPACMNRNSPTFPNRVKAECGQKHMAGTCGFPVINGCACIEGRCSDVTAEPARPR